MRKQLGLYDCFGHVKEPWYIPYSVHENDSTENIVRWQDQ